MENRMEPELGGILCNAIEASDSGFAVLDAEDRFVYCNPTYKFMFGLQGQAIAGRRYVDVLSSMHERHARDPWPEPQNEWLDYVMAQHRHGESPSFEIDTVDGRHLLINEMVCSSGEVTQHSRDITNMRVIEKSLLDAKEALQRMALNDELTGLPNRGQFLQVLDRELARVSRHGVPLSIAVLGIDYFRQVVIAHGPDRADIVVQHLSRLLQASLRKTDLAARVSDAEFAVLLPDTPSTDTLNIFRRLCDRVSSMSLPEVSKDFSYSFSGGVVTSEARYPVSSDWVMDCADKALAQARAAGRNCVVPYSN